MDGGTSNGWMDHPPMRDGKSAQPFKGRPLTFFEEPKLCPLWAISSQHPLRGGTEGKGGALPLWRGFFCFKESGKPPPWMPHEDIEAVSHGL